MHTIKPALSATARRTASLEAALAQPAGAVVYPSAIFASDAPALRAEHVIAHTGVIGLDIDDIDAEAALARLRTWPHTRAAVVSSSGSGIHLYVKIVPPPTGLDSLSAYHAEAIGAVRDALHADLNLDADTAALDVTRQFVVSGETPHLAAEDKTLPLVPRLANTPRGARHDTLLHYTFDRVVHAGASKADVLTEARIANARFHYRDGDGEPDTVIDALVKNLIEREQSTADTEEHIAASVKDVAEIMRDTVTFRVRYNTVTGALEVYDARRAEWYIGGASDDIIAIADSELPPIVWAASKRTVTRTVPAAVLKRATALAADNYDPFAALRDLVGNEVSPASDALVATAVDVCWQQTDLELDRGIAIWHALYRDLGLRIALATATDRMPLPQFMLTLVGPQGCGKSAFVEELLPLAWRSLFSSLSATNLRDAALAVSSNLVLELAEAAEVFDSKRFDALSRGDIRRLITEPTLATVDKYERHSTLKRNRAVIIATANPDGRVLLDGAGGRRQVLINYPAYPSVQAAMEAGLECGDFMRAHSTQFIARGYHDALRLLRTTDAPLVSAVTPAELGAWVSDIHDTGHVDAEEFAIARVFVQIICDVADWRDRLPLDIQPISFDERGGVDPTTLRFCVQQTLGGERISSTRINRTLSLRAGVTRSRSAGQTHHHRGLRIDDPHALLSLAESVDMLDACVEAVKAKPAAYAHERYRLLAARALNNTTGELNE